MKTFSQTIRDTLSDDDLAAISAIDPTLIVLFFAPKQANSPALLQKIYASFPDIPVVGCSTAGEISDRGLSDDSLSLMALHLDKTPVKTAARQTRDVTQSYQAAHDLGTELKADDLKAIMILSPGLNINGSEVVRGITDAVGKGPVVFGGLAGDNTDFTQTWTFSDGALQSDKIVAVGFYGDAIQLGSGSKGGWKPFGPARRVTKSESSVLYELDGKPALELYKQYLGDKAADLPASGLLYPFAILDDNHNQIGLIRTILNVDHDKNSLVLAGDMPEGRLVCLMHADTDELIDGAEKAASEARVENDGQTQAAFLVSCVGRKIVMAEEDVAEELEAVKGILGAQTAIAGFYSYGEICRCDGTGKPELHNQTMTIMHLSEA